MTYSDKALGLHRNITRRDLVQGLGLAAGAALLPGRSLADAVLSAEKTGYYPPALTGLRGNHDGSWEVAHAFGRSGQRNWGNTHHDDKTDYDLVVVGAGISGLSAAFFWQKQHPDARILILDNHDDFGGHAKRNEFTTPTGNLLAYGGSQSLVSPQWFPASAKRLLNGLSVDLKRFNKAYDHDFFKRNGLGPALFFDKAYWGRDELVSCNIGRMFENYLPLATQNQSMASAVEQMPMSGAAKGQLLAMLNQKTSSVPGSNDNERYAYLAGISYKDYLGKHLGITEPEVFRLFNNMASDWGASIASVPAATATMWTGLPGLDATGIDFPFEDDPYIYHFPDGNASITRLIVRHLIPSVAPGNSMEDIVTAPFDYSALDEPANNVRLRLNSTVLNVSQDKPATAKDTPVSVSYFTGRKLQQVKARNCVLACYNMMIPGICPQLPEVQKEALSEIVKSPVLYTNVALRNWKPWKKLGVGGVQAPSAYSAHVKLTFPVSIGDYKFSQSEDQPIVANMERFPHSDQDHLPRKEQWRLGRHELLATPYKDIERQLRSQLTAMLEPGGFDPAEDIIGITVNRWAHGYAPWPSTLDDNYQEDRDHPAYAHVKGRQPFGRIAIANSDAGASAMFESAVEQADRAVRELS